MDVVGPFWNVPLDVCNMVLVSKWLFHLLQILSVTRRMQFVLRKRLRSYLTSLWRAIWPLTLLLPMIQQTECLRHELHPLRKLGCSNTEMVRTMNLMIFLFQSLVGALLRLTSLMLTGLVSGFNNLFISCKLKGLKRSLKVRPIFTCRPGLFTMNLMSGVVILDQCAWRMKSFLGRTTCGRPGMIY